MNILRASGLLILVFLLNAFPLRAQQPLKFNIGAVDKSADACQDFYQYACGGWLKQHPIPADRSYRDVYQEMEEINDRRVAEILQLAESAPRNAEQRKVGDYYASCMDENAIEAKGLAALQPELERIDAMKTPRRDPHSPGRWRVNGVVSNMPSFAKAYGCNAGEKMVSVSPCRVW